MILTNLCTPALIYIIFSVTQIIIDTVRGHFNVAFVKFWISIIFTLLLNFLCNKGLGIISWFIVFLPFILMTAIVSILLVMFGLDPLTGKKRIIKEIDSVNNEEILTKNKKNGLKFTPYYLNLERKRNKGNIGYSQDMTNDFENDLKEYLLYRKLRNEKYKKKIQERKGNIIEDKESSNFINIGNNDSIDDDLISVIDNEEDDNYSTISPKPYEPPKNQILCNKPTNKPLGCPCLFGSSCKSGNCDINYNVCIKENSNKDTKSSVPSAPNTINQQQQEMKKRQADKLDCENNGNSWNGVNCIKNE